MSALSDLRAAVARGEYVVLDTETTGLKVGEICQIAIVDSAGNVLLDSLVKPRDPIPPDATEIHGITNADVAEAIAWKDLARKVHPLLHGKAVIAYNADFDLGMMRQSSWVWSLDDGIWDAETVWACAMKAYAEFRGERGRYGFKWHKLGVACIQQGIIVENAHNALGDCLMTLALVQKMTAG